MSRSDPSAVQHFCDGVAAHRKMQRLDAGDYRPFVIVFSQWMLSVMILAFQALLSSPKCFTCCQTGNGCVSIHFGQHSVNAAITLPVRSVPAASRTVIPLSRHMENTYESLLVSANERRRRQRQSTRRVRLPTSPSFGAGRFGSGQYCKKASRSDRRVELAVEGWLNSLSGMPPRRRPSCSASMAERSATFFWPEDEKSWAIP